MSEQLKPGTECNCDCEYELIDRNGNRTGKFVTMHKGDRLPPSDYEGECYCPCTNGRS